MSPKQEIDQLKIIGCFKIVERWKVPASQPAKTNDRDPPTNQRTDRVKGKFHFQQHKERMDGLRKGGRGLVLKISSHL